MKHILCLLLLTVATACANKRTTKAAETPTRPSNQFTAAPARITQVNDQLKFVVIDFNSRTMPSIGAVLSVYRADQRVGSVKITEPIRTHFATADILDGDVLVGDEAR